MAIPEREASPSEPAPSDSDAGEVTTGGSAASSAPRPATPGGDVQAEADRLIKGLEAELGAEAAVYAVAVLANRAAAELHRLAKSEATARKGTPEWGTWAALQNSARKLVLDSSTARDGAARLAGRPR